MGSRFLAVVWLTIAFSLGTGRVEGQSFRTILLLNGLPPTLDAPVYDVDGVTRLEGSRYLAQFYVGVAYEPGSAPLPSLKPVGPIIPFGTHDQAGFIRPEIQQRELQIFRDPAGINFLELRAWDAQDGPTFEAAVAARGSVGSSDPIALGSFADFVQISAPVAELRPFQLWPEGRVRSIGLKGWHFQTTNALRRAVGDRLSIEANPGNIPNPENIEWFKDNVLIPGTELNRIATSGLLESDTGVYQARYQDALGLITSRAHFIEVQPHFRLLRTIVRPETIVAGQPFEVELIFEQDKPIRIHWSHEQTLLQTGSSSILRVSAAQLGAYTFQLEGPTTGAREGVAVRVINSFLLNASASIGGSVQVTPHRGPVGYRAGEYVRLHAHAEPMYVFSHWTGDLQGSGNPSVLLMDGQKTVHAQFRPLGGTINFLPRKDKNADPKALKLNGFPLDSDHWGQFFVGPSPESLSAFEEPWHIVNGYRLPRNGDDRKVLTWASTGQTVYVQFRVWNKSHGGLWIQAANNGEFAWTASEIIAVRTGGHGHPPEEPAFLTGMTPFSLRSAPEIPAFTRSYRVATGNPLEITAGYRGSEPLTFQWWKDGQILPGETGPNFSRNRAAIADSGAYQVRVSNRYGSAESPICQVDVRNPPRIVATTISPTPRAYEQFTLTLSTEDADDAVFSWSVDNRGLGGGPGMKSITINDARPGVYRVTVANLVQAATHDVLTLKERYRLSVRTEGPGSVRVTPASAYYDDGSVVELEGFPTGEGEFGIWDGGASSVKPKVQVVMDRDRDVVALFFGTGGTLFAANRLSGQGVDAPVFDVDGITRLEGDAFRLQLYGGPIPELIVPAGEPLPFRTGEAAGYFLGTGVKIPSVRAGSSAWIQVRAWEAAKGATFEEAFANNGKVGASETFQVRTGGAGSPPSFPGYLFGLQSFKLSTPAPPTLSEIAGKRSYFVGETLRLTASADGIRPLALQWFRDGLAIPEAIGPNLEIPFTRLTDAGAYTLGATNIGGETLSAPAAITVVEPRQIALIGPSEKVYGGDSVVLIANASGRTPFRIDWFEGESGDTSRPVGDGLPEFATPELKKSTAYWARVTDPLGSTDSATLLVTVDTRPQQLALDVPPSAVYGQPPLPIVARAESGLPVAIEVVSGPGQILGTDLQLIGAGEVLIRATQPGDETRWAPVVVERKVNVAKAGVRFLVAQKEVIADGNPRSPVIITDPPGLKLRLAFNDQETQPSQPGEYRVRATVDDANHEGSTEVSFRIWPDAFDLTGTLYEDRDGSGTREESEPLLAGVSLRLRSEEPEKTVVTGESGRFEWLGLTSGTYVVNVEDPQGFISTTPRLRTITGTARDSIELNFGMQPVASISGSVYVDSDGDGLRGESEVGLPGVRIALRGAGAERSISTDAEGGYRFLDVIPGSYTVQEDDPPGYVSSTPNLRSVSVGPQGAASATFGDRPSRSISGVVYEDSDGNGTRDAGEPGVENVTVRLVRDTTEGRNGPPLKETKTNAAGNFAFTDVPGGDYVVRQEPTGLLTDVVLDTGGSNRTAHSLHADPTGAIERRISLLDGGAGSARFGLLPVGQLSGIVFEDLDADGRRSANEPGLGGVRVDIRNAETGLPVASAKSQAHGAYAIPGLAPGVYEVSHVALAGFQPAPTKRATLRNGGALALNLPNRATGTVWGRVFNDQNANADWDPGELGIGDVTVLLEDANDVTASTRTAADGTFAFAGVLPGPISISHAAPAGFEPTTPERTTVQLERGHSATARFGHRSPTVRSPQLQIQTRNATGREGSRLELEADANGTQPLLYQWYYDSRPIPNATNRTLTLPSLKLSDSGAYQIQVRNPVDSITSDRIQLTVERFNPLAEWAEEEGLIEGQDGPQDDPDGDHFPNAVEFVFGTDPLKPEPRTSLRGLTFASDGRLFVAIEFDRSYRAINVRYIVERSRNLSDWDEFLATVNVVSAGTTFETIRMIDPTPLPPGDFRFLRLRFELK